MARGVSPTHEMALLTEKLLSPRSRLGNLPIRPAEPRLLRPVKQFSAFRLAGRHSPSHQQPAPGPGTQPPQRRMLRATWSTGTPHRRRSAAPDLLRRPEGATGWSMGSASRQPTRVRATCRPSGRATRTISAELRECRCLSDVATRTDSHDLLIREFPLKQCLPRHANVSDGIDSDHGQGLWGQGVDVMDKDRIPAAQRRKAHEHETGFCRNRCDRMPNCG